MSRDLERYAGLFAARTRVMRSSAMRDLMALTERKDIISLAGGLPDTSSFPAESFAAIMSRVAVDSCARSLQYGPTEGLTVLKSCIAEVMEEEGTLIDPDRHVLLDPVELTQRCGGSDLGQRIERIAHADLRRLSSEALDEFVAHGSLHERARGRHA